MEPETTGASACSMSSESKQHHSEYDHVGDGDLSKHRTGRTELECGLPLSKSVLYTLQRAFYQSHSVDAWTKSIVPNYITTNQYIADQYALGFCGMQCHAVREVAVGATLVTRCYHRARVQICKCRHRVLGRPHLVGKLGCGAPGHGSTAVSDRNGFRLGQVRTLLRHGTVHGACKPGCVLSSRGGIMTGDESAPGTTSPHARAGVAVHPH